MGWIALYIYVFVYLYIQHVFFTNWCAPWIMPNCLVMMGLTWSNLYMRYTSPMRVEDRQLGMHSDVKRSCCGIIIPVVYGYFKYDMDRLIWLFTIYTDILFMHIYIYIYMKHICSLYCLCWYSFSGCVVNEFTPRVSPFTGTWHAMGWGPPSIGPTRIFWTKLCAAGWFSPSPGFGWFHDPL